MRRLWSALAVVVALFGAGAGTALAPLGLTELSIDGPIHVLSGTEATFEGEHRARYVRAPAARVELVVDGVVADASGAANGRYSLDATLQGRGIVRVHAVAERGLPQQSVSRVLEVAVAVPPSPPLDLSAVAAAGVRGVDLAWSAPVDDGGAPLVAFDVERRAPGGAFAFLTTLPATARSFRDAGAPFGSGLEYAVVARSVVAPSERAVAAATGAPPMPPTLTATPLDGVAHLSLSARATGGTTQALQIDVSNDQGVTWQNLSTAIGGSLDMSVALDFTRALPVFRAVALSAVGLSAPAEAQALGEAPGVPGAPRAEMSSVLRIAWDAPATGGAVQQYRVLDRGVAVALAPANARSVIVPVQGGVEQTFTVQALSYLGESVPSAGVTPRAPGTPALVVTPVDGTTDIRLDVARGDGTVTELRLERSLNGGNWTLLQSGSPHGFSVTTAHVSGAAYRAVARNVIGASPPASPTYGDVPPGAPPNARALVTDVVRIAWDPPADGGAVQRYRVLDRGALVAELGPTARDATVNALQGSAHEWTVVAGSIVGDGPASAPVRVERPIAPEVRVSVVPDTPRVRIDVASGADVYARTLVAERSLDGGGFVPLASGAAPNLSVTTSVDFAAPLPTFRGIARGPTGDSAPATAIVQGDVPSPATNLRLVTNASVWLLWDKASGAQAYEVRENGWTVALVHAPATSARIDPPGNLARSYTVVARNILGDAAPSTPLSVHLSPPGAPVVDATWTEAYASAHVDLTWTTPADGGATIQGYTVWRKQGSGGWVQIATTNAATRRIDNDVVAGDGTPYTYEVRAFNAMGNGHAGNTTIAPDAGWVFTLELVDFRVCRDGGVACASVADNGSYDSDGARWVYANGTYRGKLLRHGVPQSNVSLWVYAWPTYDEHSAAASYVSTNATGEFRATLSAWPIDGRFCQTHVYESMAYNHSWRAKTIFPRLTVCP